MTPDLRQIVDVAPLIQSGALSPVTLVQACLAAIDARPELNAFITRLDAQALADAERAAQEIRAGRYRGPLHGIPISVKDLIHVAGMKTTAGSAQPAIEPTADAPAVARLRGGRRDHHRQDEPPRVRVRHDERGIRLRPRAPSARRVAIGRRIERRRGGGARDRHVLWRARHRHRRIDPHPVRRLRHGRPQGDDRRDLVRRGRPAQHLARSPGADGAQRGRRGAALRVLMGRPATAAGDCRTRLSSASRGRTSATGSIPASGRHSSGRARHSPRPAMRFVTSPSSTPPGRRTSTSTSSCPRHRAITRASSNDRRPSTRRACACGSRWDVISSRRTTSAPCDLREGADGGGRPDARRVRRAAPADAPDSGATARSHDRRGRRNPRACAGGDAAAHAALQHHRPSVRGAPGAAGRRCAPTKRADRRTTSPDRSRPDDRRGGGALPAAVGARGGIENNKEDEATRVLSGVFHAWERRLASVSTDRVVRPFEWGLDWISRSVLKILMPGWTAPRPGLARRASRTLGRPDGRLERCSSSRSRRARTSRSTASG